jgi:hypothetical protein
LHFVLRSFTARVGDVFIGSEPDEDFAAFQLVDGIVLVRNECGGLVQWRVPIRQILDVDVRMAADQEPDLQTMLMNQFRP